MLFIEGVPDAIICKMTGHRSEELKCYKHLLPSFTQQTTELIADKLADKLEEMGKFFGTVPENDESRQTDGSEITDNK